MIQIKILDTFGLMSLQDIGRFGYQSLGISESGAIDTIGYYHNLALLNIPSTESPAIIEICGRGGVFETNAPVIFALSGAKFETLIDHQNIMWGRNYILYPGQKLIVKDAINNGHYGYIGFSGGIDCQDILGSKTTHISNGFGGFQGQYLQKYDILNVISHQITYKPMMIKHKNIPKDIIYILPHPQTCHFSEKQIDDLESYSFSISPNFNRMTAILTPEKDIFHESLPLSLLSEATICGDLQITGDGNLHLLLNERQPTGGYPRIATVISSHIPSLAQMPFRHNFRFQFIDIDHAQLLYREYRHRIRNIHQEIVHVKNNLDNKTLMHHNLISGIADIHG